MTLELCLVCPCHHAPVIDDVLLALEADLWDQYEPELLQIDSRPGDCWTAEQAHAVFVFLQLARDILWQNHADTLVAHYRPSDRGAHQDADSNSPA